jgi:D-alanyl-D-alanine carboxypeptidase/D-alanyl-D-alanine-endopeptidase (penicillin-binding protein 4)
MCLAKRQTHQEESVAMSSIVRALLICLSLGFVSTNHAQQTNPPATLSELQRNLTEFVSQPRFAAGTFGVKVVSLETGKTLFAHDADKLLSPASNCKIYTMAMVLDKLGGDYRIKTALYSAVKPDKRGNIKGDLILYGRGDPGFNMKAGDGDIFRALQPLVAALTNAGVRRISGDLIGDDSFIVGAPFGSGWVWDDMNYYYGAEISALTINDNTLEVSVTPGATSGMPAQLDLSPITRYVVLSNRTQTVAATARRNINFYRPLGQNVIYVTGQMPLGTNYTDDVTFSNPAGLFVALFKEALARNGIKIAGKTRTVNWLDRQGVPLDTSKLIELGAVESKPLREINIAVQKPSQNLYTDLMLAHVGSLERERALAERVARNTNAPLETVVGTISSEDYGIRELDKFLAKASVKRGDVRFEEGSGLSRNNLATPNATIALLEFMSKHAEAKSYYDALPIAGKDGTLRNRLKNTRAAGNVHAKTGTLRWANSTSGYVTTAAGERLAFCLMLNRYAAPSPEFSPRGELDKIIVLLADFTGRSDQ